MSAHRREGAEFTLSPELGDPVYDRLLLLQSEATDKSNANEQQASKSIRSMIIMVEPPGLSNGISTGGHLYFATSTGLSHEIEIGTALIPTVDEVVASNAFLSILKLFSFPNKIDKFQVISEKMVYTQAAVISI